MPDKPFSAEPIVIVRIAQPRCALSHGVAPCTATGTPCFNTFSTCTDKVNHTTGAPLDLYFGIAGQGAPSDEIMILPFLAGWPSISPARVNVSGADRRINPLGMRATAKISFRDAPHSDFLVDPYRETRGVANAGTFWSKWLKRNLYGKAGMEVSIFEGFAGDALADMTHRLYVCEAIDFSGEERVVMDCRDILSKATDGKALIPPISPGYLLADLPETETATFKIAGAVVADYPASGTLRINRETITYSAIAEDANGFLDVTIWSRATDGTALADHAAEDRVQECFRFTDEPVDVGLARLYGYTTIDAQYLPLADWAEEAGTFLASYRLDGLVTEPTDADLLVGEVLEQCQAIQWWDEEAKAIRFVAVKPLVARPKKLTEAEHIVAGTVSLRDFPDRRVSRVYVYFDQRDPTERREEGKNYRALQGSLELGLEDEKAFGEKAVRNIYARFINSRPIAQATTGRLIARYKNGSREVSFAVSDKDADISVGDVVSLSLRRVQDTNGAPVSGVWIITSRDPRPSERRVYFTAEDAALAGQLVRIAEAGLGPYVGDGSDPFGVGWISGGDGLLPNGDAGFLIQ